MPMVIRKEIAHNCSQGAESSESRRLAYLRLQPGLRMQNTLHQAADENLRPPVSSYKYGGLPGKVANPVSSCDRPMLDMADYSFYRPFI